jgi:valyl-tRNA synthetase
MNLPDDFKSIPIETIKKDIFDNWILHSLNNTIKTVTEFYENARLNDAARVLYSFFWNDFCDWYVELSKSKIFGEDQEIKQNTLSILIFILQNFYKLLHPIMPFITEELFQKLPEHTKSIMTADFPEYSETFDDSGSLSKAEKFFNILYLIRNIRGEMNVPADRKIEVLIKTKDEDLKFLALNYEKDILFLAKAVSLKLSNDLVKPKGSAVQANEICEIYLPLGGLIDIDAEINRLSKEITKTNQELSHTESKLNNPSFTDKAPAEVIDKEKSKQIEFSEKIMKLTANLELLKNI